MAYIQMQTLSWHEGEIGMRKAMRAPEIDNPTVPALSPQLAHHLRVAPLISIGALDADGRPWTTLWGNGEKGFAQPIGEGVIGIKTPVTGHHDPVIEEIFGKDVVGQKITRAEDGKGRMVSGLTIDLETRKRVKMYGRMLGGALTMNEDEVAEHEEHVAEVQMVLKIEQSLGNCPKYLNKKHIVSALAKPELVSDSPHLPQQAIDLIEKADLFFVSSRHGEEDMDTNHRGGPAGFLRVESNNESGAVLCYPEYSGNRLYQTLGNLRVNPLAGLCIPDFETGDMLYLTGKTEILVGPDAAAVIPRSNLAVRITTTGARYVARALPFRGIQGDRSPYNPNVRYLASEKAPAQVARTTQQATLLHQVKLTPNVSRFRFSLQNAATYKPGQYVTFDFSSHLDMGYSHMADDDPRSINDDFVRTFTVSSTPGDPPNPVRNLADDEFEITIRKVGTATDFLFRHMGKGSSARGMHELEVPVLGFGGEFEVQQDAGETIAFVTAGVGITPILPSLGRLDYSRLKLLWSVREDDVELVLDVLKQHPRLAESLSVFVTNAKEGSEAVGKLKGTGVVQHSRRIQQSDLAFDREVQKYYLCTPVPMRKQLMEWLPEKDLIFEDFNF
ncbi:oxidoreductase-like protein [Neohortaea acidophila]|uniref:Oxidoreductase-like protein n=1 Tax=Neohortaea acidophila TaxID=245834 RepID=A0A6A6PRZ5_9PEZI|nr:oxidoreductase-like protein [Neohortaea acidophila]KAF2482434.1 oxidoreductase-like protein [Neohortaea acidophila]